MGNIPNHYTQHTPLLLCGIITVITPMIRSSILIISLRTTRIPINLCFISPISSLFLVLTFMEDMLKLLSFSLSRYQPIQQLYLCYLHLSLISYITKSFVIFRVVVGWLMVYLNEMSPRTRAAPLLLKHACLE